MCNSVLRRGHVQRTGLLHPVLLLSLLPFVVLMLLPVQQATASSTTAAFLSGPRGALCKRVSSLLSLSRPTAAFPSTVLSFTKAPTTSNVCAGTPATPTGLLMSPRHALSRLALVSLPEFAAYSAKVETGLGTNTVLALLGLAVKQRWLTSSGLLHAWALGVALWSTLGWRGWALCVLYLIFGSLVTKVKQAEKEALGIAEKRGGARGPENVWGSAAAVRRKKRSWFLWARTASWFLHLSSLVLAYQPPTPPPAHPQGTLCALATLFLPAWVPVLLIGYVASLATKLSDTFASEIGKAYGKRTFLITTFKPVPPGTEGAVSLEGTLAGVMGSILIAGAGVGLQLMAWNAVPLVLVAAFAATNVESLLGASLQNDQHPWATNEFINFLNTLIGSVLGIGMAVALRLPLPA